MGDHIEYLGIHILNEQQYVNYRSLSRALKVHSNLAKQMLFEFHNKQNAKKPGSVHATYLISGTKVRRTPVKANGIHLEKDGEDTFMQSSPPLPSSSMPATSQDAVGERECFAMKTVMLVKQEHLEDAKASFESISSMHIYSLQQGGLGDIQALAECNRQVTALHASEDPVKDWKKYGTIQNSDSRRRTTRQAPTSAAPAEKAAPTTKRPPLTESTLPEQQSAKGLSAQSREAREEAENHHQSKPAEPKRAASGIFKAFAKPKTKPGVKSNNASPAATPAAEAEDETMGGLSADDDDDGDTPVVDDDIKVPEGKSRKDRQAELEAMMDAEDNDMVDTHDDGAIDARTSKPHAEEESGAEEDQQKDQVEVSKGRRRGRRRVMKKKTVKDEEGYLVTKEEPAWESFSEDEPAPKRARSEVSAPATSAKTGKKASRPGQGNIMSFFTKK